MNTLIVFLAPVVVVVMASEPYTGIPIAKCPPGEHSVLYCPQQAEPDCDIREVHEPTKNRGLCDVPQCFCNVPTIRNLKTGKCVLPADCPPRKH